MFATAPGQAMIVRFSRDTQTGALTQTGIESNVPGLERATSIDATTVSNQVVVGTDGSLTGYGGGIENKRALLDFERGQAAFAGR